MDNIEHQMMRSLIAKRELHPDSDQIHDLERKLHEYQIKIGSVAAHFTYEKGELRG